MKIYPFLIYNNTRISLYSLIPKSFRLAAAKSFDSLVEPTGEVSLVEYGSSSSIPRDQSSLFSFYVIIIFQIVFVNKIHIVKVV